MGSGWVRGEICGFGLGVGWVGERWVGSGLGSDFQPVQGSTALPRKPTKTRRSLDLGRQPPSML